MADESLEGIRLLVLGAGALHETAFLTWARHGCRVTLVHGDESHGYEELVDRFVPWPVHDDQQPDVDRLATLASGHEAVLTLSEMAQLTTAAVTHRTGHRGTGLTAAAVARDKHRQRELAAGAGLRTVRSQLRSRGDDMRHTETPGGPPWVVKPVDSGGSAAVTFVDRAEALTTALGQALAQSGSGRAVVEEHIPGREWSVEALVVGGEVVFTAPTSKTLVGPRCFIERRHVVGPVANPATEHLLTDATRRFVAMLEVDTALCHVELRIDDGRVTPIEGAVRPAGDGIIELVRLAHGRDLYVELVAALAARPTSPARPPTARFAGAEFLIASGQVQSQAAPAVAAGLKGIRHVVSSLGEGTTLPPLEANWSRAGRAVGVADTAADLEERLDEAVQRLADALGVTRA